MKKTFPLNDRGHAAERVVEAIKHDVRKYVKRERAKSLPEGFSAWDFACKVGATATTAEVKTLNEIAPAIDEVVKTGAPGVYIEILATPGHRVPRTPVVPPPPAPAAGEIAE